MLHEWQKSQNSKTFYDASFCFQLECYFNPRCEVWVNRIVFFFCILLINSSIKLQNSQILTICGQNGTTVGVWFCNIPKRHTILVWVNLALNILINLNVWMCECVKTLLNTISGFQWQQSLWNCINLSQCQFTFYHSWTRYWGSYACGCSQRSH